MDTAPVTNCTDRAAAWATAAAIWAKMDLSHVFGFPMWEKDVYELLQKAHGELKSIFDHYSKAGSAGSGSATAAMTMQQTELVDVALDCGLTSETFPMVRVQNIFERADQVDDTFKVSAADRRVVTGETAKGGDRGLELHEFLEALVLLGFSLANPKYGEVGHNFAAEVDAGKEIGRAHV